MMVFPGELDGGGARELSGLEIWAGVCLVWSCLVCV